ncbi:hypothetical protein F5882DRAFT_395965 [Hyaloscypha sp. PMI_1271]|nr:hypothetical protein F5882DRAFT_395965 [Hyaloscypha sp. PMI_1271]
MTSLGTAESQHGSSSAPKDSNQGSTVNFKEDPHPDPEKGASGNDGEDCTEEGGYSFLSLLSHAKRQFVFWWFWGAVILAILLALSATRFRTVHIHEVRLFGLFCWLAISWAGLLASYLFAWVLSYFWFIVCNLFDEGDIYNTFFLDIRRSTMLLAWGFICWSTVPLLCRVDRHHCTAGWVHTFQKVMLATLVVDFVYFAKDLLLELLFLRAVTEFLHPRRKKLKKTFDALELLVVEPSKPSFSLDYLFQKWVEYFLCPIILMRRWCSPEKEIKIESEEDQPGQDDFEDTHSENPISVLASFVDLSTGYGTKKGYRIVTRYIKRLMPKCDLEDPSAERPSIKAQTQRGWSKKRPSRDPSDPSDPLFNCIHERVRSCGGARQTITGDGFCRRQVYRRFVSGDHAQSTSKANAHPGSSGQLWGVLDRNRDGFASFEELHWLVEDLGESLKEVYSGQRNLMTVIRELNLVLSIILLAPAALIYVLFFVKNPGHYLGPVWATFAGLSFSLQGPVKSFADACVFVFSQHPYDVGDWVIWGKEKDLKLIVDEIHLLKTAFTCADSGKTVHIPHTEICTGYIENLSRTSTYYVESIVLHSEDKVDRCHKEAIRKFQQEELRDLWRNDEKREIFRYYQLPEINVVPMNSEDLEEKGIRVDFKRKEWAPGRFFRHEERCRQEVMSFIREHLPDLIKPGSKFDSGVQGKSGATGLENPASSNGESKSEEEIGQSLKPPNPTP